MTRPAYQATRMVNLLKDLCVLVQNYYDSERPYRVLPIGAANTIATTLLEVARSLPQQYCAQCVWEDVRLLRTNPNPNDLARDARYIGLRGDASEMADTIATLCRATFNYYYLDPGTYSAIVRIIALAQPMTAESLCELIYYLAMHAAELKR